MADISKRIPNCGDGEGGKHDCDCRADQKTIRGSGAKKDPFRAVGLLTAPFIPPVVKTIYVRPNGSNEHGDGKTPETAYRTFQYAITKVPNYIPPRETYVVDVTDLGVEVFPDDYIMPSIFGGWDFEFAAPNPYWIPVTPLNILANPKITTGVPAADATISAGEIVAITPDPDTGLIAIQTTKTWPIDALKGKLMVGAGGAFENGTIYKNTADTLYVCQAGIPTAPLKIMEPSAEFRVRGTIVDGDGYYIGFQATGVGGLILGGIKFVNEVSGDPFQMSLMVRGFRFAAVLASDVDGLSASEISYVFAPQSSYVHDRIMSMSNVELYTHQTLWENIATWQWYAPNEADFFQDVVLSCPCLGTQPYTVAHPSSIQYVIAQNCLFDGAVPDPATGDPGNQFFLQSQGSISLESCRIDNAQANAIASEFCTGFILLNHVTGSNNALYGVSIADGASCRVMDNDTTVGGTAGDMLIGVLPMRTWSDFRANAPIRNQYDLIGMNPNATDQSTGSRLFQR